MLNAGRASWKEAETKPEPKQRANLLTWRLNSQLRHAGLDPASSVLLDSRFRGNDNLRVFIRRSNKLDRIPYGRCEALSHGRTFLVACCEVLQLAI